MPYGNGARGCYKCGDSDRTCSGEPKYAAQPLPQIAPEVIALGGIKPTGLTYDVRNPPRGDIAISGLNLIDNSHTGNPLMVAYERLTGAPIIIGAPTGAKGRENRRTTVTLYKTEWCGFCKQMKPVFDKVAADCAGKNIDFKVVDCDVEDHPEIRSYPTIVLTDEMGKSYTYKRMADYQQLLAFVLSPVH
jgi:thiol-disulfide isomerase/thioredoxin